MERQLPHNDTLTLKDGSDDNGKEVSVTDSIPSNEVSAIEDEDVEVMETELDPPVFNENDKEVTDGIETPLPDLDDVSGNEESPSPVLDDEIRDVSRQSSLLPSVEVTDDTSYEPRILVSDDGNDGPKSRSWLQRKWIQTKTMSVESISEKSIPAINRTDTDDTSAASNTGTLLVETADATDINTSDFDTKKSLQKETNKEGSKVPGLVVLFITVLFLIFLIVSVAMSGKSRKINDPVKTNPIRDQEMKPFTEAEEEQVILVDEDERGIASSINSPTASPTLPPVPCADSIVSVKPCYVQRPDTIVIQVSLCEPPKAEDWIGIYFDGVDPQNLGNAASAWSHVCGENQECSDEHLQNLEVEFPIGLVVASYKAFLIRSENNGPVAPYVSEASTEVFSVSRNCGGN